MQFFQRGLELLCREATRLAYPSRCSGIPNSRDWIAAELHAGSSILPTRAQVLLLGSSLTPGPDRMSGPWDQTRLGAARLPVRAIRPFRAVVLRSAMGRRRRSGSSFRASKRKPVVTPPAEHAANRSKSKQGAKSVQRMHFTRFETDRVAAGTSAPEPQHAWQPVRPHFRRFIH